MNWAPAAAKIAPSKNPAKPAPTSIPIFARGAFDSSTGITTLPIMISQPIAMNIRRRLR